MVSPSTVVESPASSSAAENPTAEPSAAHPVTPSPEPEVALTQAFTSPDGTLSFRYPEHWTVTGTDSSTRDTQQWEVRDTEGERVLSLSVSPDGYVASPPMTPVVLPQGKIPGMTDTLGKPARAAVGASPGQAVGANVHVLYGMTSATGADPVFGNVRWGEGAVVSFTGFHEAGANDRVDLATEAEEFAAGPRFRREILPVLLSFTAASAPSGSDGETGAPGTPSDTGADGSAPGATASCIGAEYAYENLKGVGCQRAKLILQEVADTGEPIGVRGQRTADYHCFWSSVGEKKSGAPDVLCRDRVDESVIFEAVYR